jgi:hypothetical protein
LTYGKYTTGSVASQFKKNSKSKKAPLSTRLEQRMSDPFSNKHAAPGGAGVVERTSDDDATAFSHSEEKIVGAENGSAVMVIGAGNDAISPLPHTYPTRRSSLNSASVRHREREGSNGSFTVENAVYANGSGGGATTTRRKSVDYRAPSSLVRSHSTTAGEQQQQQQQQFGAEMVPMGRSLSTGARKTPRKPVPQYNPAEFSHHSKGGRRSGGSESQIGLDDSGDDGGRNGNKNGSVHSHGNVTNGNDHSYGHGNRERDVGRPVHYLIPDMPLT